MGSVNEGNGSTMHNIIKAYHSIFIQHAKADTRRTESIMIVQELGRSNAPISMVNAPLATSSRRAGHLGHGLRLCFHQPFRGFTTEAIHHTLVTNTHGHEDRQRNPRL
ncbi:hypothetical protein ACH5RR_018073 [Cinchona calisaya]|uniref:Uncharacterized protein n=1 Tax=Cinchona calisaya TaxID=153742 RepID=A0ABD2ZL12_9GENT